MEKHLLKNSILVLCGRYLGDVTYTIDRAEVTCLSCLELLLKSKRKQRDEMIHECQDISMLIVRENHERKENKK